MTRFKTTQKTYVFAAPFKLTGFDHSFPAGSYTVEIEEEMMEGMSFVALKHIGTTMRIIHTLKTCAEPESLNKTFHIDPRDFDMALLKDRHQCNEESSTKYGKDALSKFDRRAISTSENEGMTSQDYTY